MKSIKRQGKAHEKKLAACAMLAPTPEEDSRLKTAEIMVANNTTLEKSGQNNPTWQVHKDWPNFFTILKMQKNDERPIYRVKMAESLDARFSALCKGNTNAKVAEVYKALHQLHLCKVGEDEFGSSIQMFLGIDSTKPLNVAQIDPFCITELQRALQVVEPD